MLEAISTVALLVVPWALGAAVLAVHTRVGTCWWLGMTAAAGVVVVGYGVGLPRSVVLTAIFGASVILPLWALWRRPHRPIATSRDILHASLLGLLLLPLLSAMFLRTLDYPALGADAIVIWYAKAKALYEWLPFSARPFANYPDLGSAAWMLVLTGVGPDRENIGRLIFVLPYLFWMLALLELFKRPYPWATVIAVPTVALLFFDFPRFTRGDQDGLVMMTAGMAALFMVKVVMLTATRDRSSRAELAALLATPRGRQDCLLAAFFAGVLGLIKQEGAVVGLLLGLTGTAILLAHDRPARWAGILRQLLPYGGLTLGLVVLWPVLLAGHGIDVTKVQDQHFNVASAMHALGNLDRWPTIRTYFGAHYRAERWVLLACLVLSVGAAWMAARVRAALLLLWAVYGLHAIFVGFVFLATREQVRSHLDTAFDRLMLQGRFALATLLCVTLVTLGAQLESGDLRR